MLHQTLSRLNAKTRQGVAGTQSTAGHADLMAWARGAMRDANTYTDHLSKHDRVKRFWMGDSISTGSGGQINPGHARFGWLGQGNHYRTDLGRLEGSVMDWAAQKSIGNGNPLAHFGANPYRGLAARNTPLSIASLHSAQVARDSLAKTGTTLHPERSSTPVFGRVKPIATAIQQSQLKLGGDVKPAIGTKLGLSNSTGIFGQSSRGGLLANFRAAIGRALDATTSQVQAHQAAAPAASPAAPAPNVATASQFSFQQAPQGGSMQNPNPTDRQASVAGQLENILAKDSPLNRQAATMGLQRANQRGLLNSSMAVNAAQDAVTSNALPIASQDAGHYQGMQQANQAHGHKLSEIRASSTANAWGTMAGNMNNTTTNAQAAISAIQNNPDISAANKTTMINQVTAMRDADLQFQQSLYNNLTSLLQNADVFYSF